MKKKSFQIAAWLAAMALALAIAAHFWSSAFPVAAVPFPLARGEVKIRLENFLSAMGAPVAEYKSAILFEESTETKNFIERQYGPARLAQAAESRVKVWYWIGRWFKPGQHEEYAASADQRGGIVGYTHTIEEERPLPTLTQPQAGAVAEDFLRAHISQHPFASLRFLEAGAEQKPHRTDYTFVWEENALRMGDAPYHLEVGIQGNQLGSYSEYLKVPEGWTVEYQRQRSVNDLCYRIATFATSAIVIGLLIVFLLGVSNHQVRWCGALPWPWLLLIGAVAAATQFNNIPGILFGYPTTQQWLPFVTGSIFESARAVLGQVLFLWALVLMGDCIYRDRLPLMSSFRRALGPLALRDPQTIRAMGAGIAFALFSVAYVCLFYTAGQRLGVWCPVEVDLSKTMSGPLPWVEAMQTGLTAAFSEEMIFRAGAILLLWRIFRIRWLAILLAAASWGFMHSNYPQMPGYTRGIELTIVGIVWGVLMLRYGIVATLTAHYLYDCWMGSLITFQAAGWGNKAGAILVSTWPLALFLWGALRKGAELEPEEASIRTRPVVPRPPPRDWHQAPLALNAQKITLILAACAAALAAVAFLPKPQQKMMDLGKLDLSRQAILAKAGAALRAHGYSPDGYHGVATVYAQGLPTAYLLEHGTLGDLATLYHHDFCDLYWDIRYFRFLQPEEFEIKLDQHGRFLTWGHTLLRESPGAELDQPQARALATQTLARDAALDLSRQDLVREGPIQQEHRRDWIFGFDQKNFAWGDAKLRTYIRVQGAEAVNIIRYVKVPDAWILEHAKSGWKQLISGEFQHWTQWAVDALMGALLVLAIRKHVTPWRKAFLYALFPLAIGLVDQANQSGQFYAGYDTTVPPLHYLATQLGSRAVSLIWGYLTDVFVTAVALGMLHWAWGWTVDQFVFWPTRPGERRLFWRDTLLVAFASIVAFSLLDLANTEALGHFWPADAAAIRYWSIEEWVPWIGALTGALQQGYDQLIHIALQASVLRLIWKRYPRLAWALLFLLPLLHLAIPATFGAFVWGLIYSEAVLLLTAWLVLKVWRFNAVALFLTYSLSSLWDSGMLFIQKGGPTYQWQAFPLIGLMFAALMVLCWKLAKTPKLEFQNPSPPPQSA